MRGRAARHPEAISDLPFSRYLVSFSPDSHRVQVRLKGAKRSPGKAALASAASERPCRVCSALCWPTGPTAGRPASSGWACSRNDQNRRLDLLVFPSALRPQTSSPCTLFPGCTVSRARGLGPHKGSKAVVSPMEAGRSEASLGSRASHGKKSRSRCLQNLPSSFLNI